MNRLKSLGVFALAIIAGCAHDRYSHAHTIVVFGKVETFDYEPLDDFGLNGQMTARLYISRVVSGRPPSQVLTIRYIDHSGLAEDQDHRLRLRQSSGGIWLVCALAGGRGYTC